MRAGRAIAVLATLVATAGGADVQAAPFAPFARTDGTTFTVTSAADTDDGTCDADCTLREAIGASNAVAGPDTNTIAFAIAPDGPATITLSSSLPAVARPVLIDGSTQPGIDDGTPRIEVTTTAGLDRLLDFEAGANSTVRSLSLHGTASTGVYVGGTATGVVVQQCFIGTARDGTSPSHDLTTGVELLTDGNLVEANVIANSLFGVDIADGDQNELYSNLIGLGRFEGADYGYGTANDGVRIRGGTNAEIIFNTIGAVSIGVHLLGTTATVSGADVGNNRIGFVSTSDARPVDIGVRADTDVRSSSVRNNNIMAGRGAGVELLGTQTVSVVGNYVGSDGPLGNGADGIYVGGATAAQVYGNVVRHSGGAGVHVAGGADVQIQANSIQDNTGLGIDLAGDGPTVNDTPDADGIQNYPLVTAEPNGDLTLTIDGLPNETYDIEAFASPACDPSGFGEGETLIVDSIATTDATGHAALTQSPSAVYQDEAVTATATRSDGESSEFSPCLGYTPPAPAPTPTVPPTPAATSPVEPTAVPPAAATPTPVPPPVAGQSVDVAPVSGTVLVKRKGSKVATPLKAGEQIPLGSLVDATDGRVRLTSAAAKGATQTADFYGGAFVVTQAAGLVTELRLATPKHACESAAHASRLSGKPKKKKSKKTVAEVWGDGKGGFRTRGGYGSAAIRGTKWLTRERCDGTFFKVAAGVVTVRDFPRGRTVVLRAPHTYLAKAR